jgi:hypothetical protein
MSVLPLKADMLSDSIDVTAGSGRSNRRFNVMLTG